MFNNKKSKSVQKEKANNQVLFAPLNLQEQLAISGGENQLAILGGHVIAHGRPGSGGDCCGGW